jgi:restriction system protein
LLVSWGGFTKALRQEARQGYFKVRLWGAGELLQAVYRTYEQLPEEIQAELPLKRVWALIAEELE